MDYELLAIVGLAAAIFCAVAWGTRRQPDLQARRQIGLADVAIGDGDLDAARTHLTRAHEFIDKVRDASVQNELYYLAESRLGGVALDCEQFSEAEQHLIAAHTRCETLLAARDPSTIRSVANLGIALFELGRDNEANQAFESILRYAPNEYRPELRVTVDLLRNSGELCTAHHIYRWSLPLLERALELNSSFTEEDTNPRGPQIVLERKQQILKAIAQTHLVTTDWAAARQRIDEMVESGVPEDDPDLQAWNGYIELLACEWDTAMACFQQSRESARTHAGENSLAYADALVCLADLHRSQSEWNMARNLAERALSVREQCLEPDHWLFAVDTMRLGLICRQQGDLRTAAAHLDRALQIAQQRRRRANPTLATIWLVRGFLELDREQFSAAEQALLQARRIATEIYGAGHRMTLDSTMTLAVTTAELGHLEEAGMLITEAHTIRERHPQTVVLDTIDLHLSTAHVHLARQALPEAEQSLQAATDLIERHIGQKHYASAERFHLLGRLRLMQSRETEAEQHLRESLAIEEQIRLPDHPVIARVCTDLAEVLTAQGRTDEAAACRERAATIRAKLPPASASN